MQEFFTENGIQSTRPKMVESGQDKGMWKMKVGGYDTRKLIFKGAIEVEPFERNGAEGSFVVMARTQVSMLGLYLRSIVG